MFRSRGGGGGGIGFYNNRGEEPNFSIFPESLGPKGSDWCSFQVDAPPQAILEPRRVRVTLIPGSTLQRTAVNPPGSANKQRFTDNCSTFRDPRKHFSPLPLTPTRTLTLLKYPYANPNPNPSPKTKTFRKIEDLFRLLRTSFSRSFRVENEVRGSLKKSSILRKVLVFGQGLGLGLA